MAPYVAFARIQVRAPLLAGPSNAGDRPPLVRATSLRWSTWPQPAAAVEKLHYLLSSMSASHADHGLNSMGLELSRYIANGHYD